MVPMATIVTMLIGHLPSVIQAKNALRAWLLETYMLSGLNIERASASISPAACAVRRVSMSSWRRSVGGALKKLPSGLKGMYWGRTDSKNSVEI